MKKELAQLSNEELLKKRKAMKSSKITNAVIVGFTVGIFAYSAINNGFGLFTLFPLIIAYLIIKNSANDKILETEIDKEVKFRNLV